MHTLGWFILWVASLWALAYHRSSLAFATVTIFLVLIITTIFSAISWLVLFCLWIIISSLAILLNYKELRQKHVVLPLFELFHQSLPHLSKTEREALEAGTVGWEKELFSGNPNWTQLLKVPAPHLSKEEEAFIQGPVEQLCTMVDDWQISHDKDLSPAIWQFLKKNGFWGLIIAKEFGGKAFSAYAHSLILAKIGSKSGTLGVVVSVPNSLGPAELIHRYGTTTQKNYYLPRLASGQEIPCFALTSPHAGSDAASMTDTGIICKATYAGHEIIGIRLSWNKRYSTLPPVATLIRQTFPLQYHH